MIFQPVQGLGRQEPVPATQGAGSPPRTQDSLPSQGHHTHTHTLAHSEGTTEIGQSPSHTQLWDAGGDQSPRENPQGRGGKRANSTQTAALT